MYMDKKQVWSLDNNCYDYVVKEANKMGIKLPKISLMSINHSIPVYRRLRSRFYKRCSIKVGAIATRTINEFHTGIVKKSNNKFIIEYLVKEGVKIVLPDQIWKYWEIK